MTTLDIQRQLLSLGHDPGPIDGIPGRLTAAAIRAFQAKSGLVATGLLDRSTLSLLFARERAPGADQTIPWFAEARRLLGVAEVKGPRHEPSILSWARRLRLPVFADETPWCGLFTAHCIAAALPDEPLPGNPLGARQWLKFGREVAPLPGAVLVFWRGSRSGWAGHVGFHAGEDADAFQVLGGNQRDRVSIARIARSRLIGARWPKTAPRVAAGSARETPAPSLFQPLSTNEADTPINLAWEAGSCLTGRARAEGVRP